MAEQSVSGEFQILALDGGGIRGLFSAAVLAAVEADLDVRITDHFDLISGTSTGGIVAIALGLGMRPRDIVEFYLEEGPRIFSDRLKWRTLLQWFRPKYSTERLKRALQTRLGDRLFGESKSRLVIPSYNLGDHDVYLFRTPHCPHLKRDRKVPAWKVALASASAPTYFPGCREVDRVRLIDGGVWANNPGMAALTEAVGPLSVPLQSVKMLSVGTFGAVTTQPSRLDTGGKIAWARGAMVVDVIMRAQSLAITKQLKLLLGEDRFLRVDPLVAGDVVELDRVRDVDDLIGRAAHFSRIAMPAIAEKFTKHRAPAYSPFESGLGEA